MGPLKIEDYHLRSPGRSSPSTAAAAPAPSAAAATATPASVSVAAGRGGRSSGARKSLMTAAAIQAFSSGGILSAFAFLPTVADRYGGTEFQIGLLSALYSLTGFASFMVFGRASDVHGRRRFVRWGLALSSLLFLSLFWVWDLAGLFALRALGGFAAGIFPAALIAYVHENKGRLGRFTAFGSFGWGAGTFAAGIVASTWGLQATFLLSGAMFAGAYLCSLALPPVKGRRLRVPLFPLAVIRRNGIIFASLLVRHAGAFGVWAFWPLYLAEKGATPFWIGAILAANTLFQFGVMYLVTDRVRPTRAFPLGLGLTALTFAAFLASPDYRYLLAAQALLGTAWAFTYVGGLRFVTENNVEKATASGLLHATLGLAGIIGPFVSGAAIHYLGGGYETALWLALGAALVGLALATPLLWRGQAAPSQG